MDMKNHLACSITYYCFRMARCIVKEMVDGSICMLSWFGLGGYNGIESNEHGAFDGSGIIKKFANNIEFEIPLKSFDLNKGAKE